MNYFFALDVPDEARSKIAAFAERWQGQIDPLLRPRWVAPEDYHITLNFLGDIAPDKVPKIIRLATQTTRAQETVIVGQKIPILYPRSKPHVLWIEIISTSPLWWLADSLGHGSHSSFPVPGGRPEHRPYKPHITLARCQPNVESGPYLIDEQVFVPFTVNRFVLMQSLPPTERRNDSKSRYNIVHTFPFGNSPSFTH